MNFSRLLRAAALSAVLFAQDAARAAFPPLALKPVNLKQINSPTNIVNAGDGSGRLFVCDQPGKIYVIKNGMMQPTPFLDLSAPNGGPVIALSTGYNERGLLGLVFHPGYANPGSPGYRRFYVNYTKPYVAGVDPAPDGPTSGSAGGTLTPSCVSVIAEFQVSAGDPDRADAASERRLLLYVQPQSNHNGGQLQFGPETGPAGERYLYIGTGDGGSQQDNNLGHTGGDNTNPRPTDALGNSQDKTRLLGKILRIDPLGTNGPGGEYGIPGDNPFVGSGGGVREEIFAYGMRNPWRFSFDKRAGGTNRLFCGDVGGDRVEEVDLIVSGGNYGWRYLEGTEMPLFSSGADPNPMAPPADTPIDPIAQYAHFGQSVGSPELPQLGVSVTGGYVYRGAAIPALRGKYVFGDYGTTAGASDGRIMGLEETSPGSGVFTLTEALPLVGTNPVAGQRILTFGEDEAGEIYIGMKTNPGVLQPGADGLPAGGIYQLVAAVSGGSAVLEPSKDNTIYKDWPVNSNGQGNLFSGQTVNNPTLPRRALIAFDIAAAVPSGAVIESAQLALRMTKTVASGAVNFSLHPLRENWGEGSSDGRQPNGDGDGAGAPAATGDATWDDAFFSSTAPVAWGIPGGFFESTPSATASISAVNDTTSTFTSTNALVADVKRWLDDPSTNFGWLLKQTNENGLSATARQFASGENADPLKRPKLTIGYATQPPLTRREQWLQQYYFAGQFVDDLADDEADGVANLVEYALATSPKAANAAAEKLAVSKSLAGADDLFTVAFRRDPRAIDLNYQLQSSDDGMSWTTLVESDRGGAPSGSGFISEADLAGAAPIKLVTAQESRPTGAQPSFRLRVQRYGSAGVEQTADLTLMSLGLSATPALAAPSASSVSKNPLHIDFTLPEAALAGSVTLNFDDGATNRTLTLASTQETAGQHTFDFDPANPPATSGGAIASGGALPDATYTVTLSYQDSAGNAPATATSSVRIDTTLVAMGTFSPLAIAAGPLPDYRGGVTGDGSETIHADTQTPAPGTVVSPGSVPVSVIVHDDAGNTKPLNFSVAVFLAAPVNTAMIAQGGSAPGAGGPSGLAADAKLASFNAPATDDAGDLAFVAKFTSDTAGRGTGLFKNSGCLAILGGDASGPTAIANTKFKTFNDPVVDAGHVVFLGTISGVARSRAAAVFSDVSGTLKMIAQAGTGADGAGGATFSSFMGAAVSGDYVAIFARLTPGTGTPRVTGANNMGLWIADGAGAPVLALREQQPLGTRIIKSIVSFAAGSGSPGHGRGWLTSIPAVGGQVLARCLLADGGQAIVAVDAGDPAHPLVLSESGPGGAGAPAITDTSFTSYGLPARNFTGRSAFLGTITGSGVTRTNSRGLFADLTGAGAYAPIARTGESAGANGETFSVLKDPVLAADDALAFPATLKGGTARGLAVRTLWWKSPGQSARIVAQGGTHPSSPAPPGLAADAQWKDFTSLALPANRGPLFTGTLVPGKAGVTSATAAGVWGVDFAGDLRLLFRAGVTTIDLGAAGTKTVKSFALLKALPGSAGVTRSFSDQQELVWLATFADHTQAIVRTVIP